MIFTTGGIYSDDVAEFLARTGAKVLTKPARRDDLLQSIATVAGTTTRRQSRVNVDTGPKRPVFKHTIQRRRVSPSTQKPS